MKKELEVQKGLLHLKRFAKHKIKWAMSQTTEKLQTNSPITDTTVEYNSPHKETLSPNHNCYFWQHSLLQNLQWEELYQLLMFMTMKYGL